MARYDRIKVQTDDLKTDEFISFWERALLWLDDHKEKVMYSALGVAALAVLIGGGIYYSIQKETAAQRELYLALETFPREGVDIKPGSAQEFFTRMNAIEAGYDGTVGADMAELYKANAHYQLGEMDEAEAIYYRQATTGDRESLLNRLAALGLARVYQNREKLQEANKLLEPYRNKKDGAFAQDMELLVAANYEMMGKPVEALKVYRDFMSAYPNSTRIAKVEEEEKRISSHLNAASPQPAADKQAADNDGNAAE